MRIRKYKNIYLFFLVIIVTLGFICMNLFHNKLIQIDGRVIARGGNRIPTTSKNQKSERKNNLKFEIVAIPRKIKRIDDQISIPSKKINNMLKILFNMIR